MLEPGAPALEQERAELGQAVRGRDRDAGAPRSRLRRAPRSRPVARSVEAVEQLGRGQERPACPPRSGSRPGRRPRGRRVACPARGPRPSRRGRDRLPIARTSRSSLRRAADPRSCRRRARRRSRRRLRGQSAASAFDHGAGCARPLDVGLGDEHGCGREAARDRGEDVPLGGRIVPGDQSDATRQERERPLPLRRRRAPRPPACCFSRSSAARWSPRPKRSRREHAQPEVAAGLVQLGPSVGMHAVAVGEIELQRVELAAGHGRRRGTIRPGDP